MRDIDKSNWLACTQLEVSEEQKKTFPCPVVYWIAESKVDPSFAPMAIYDGDLLVGFLVYGLDPDEAEYWLIALLIDRKYQRRGYGRAAIKELIRHLGEQHQCEKLVLGHRADNRAAEALYTSIGFEKIAETNQEVIRSLVF
ncbi:GNAT family N-acetyltransferase [Alicyclobacillus sp. ALC3]|nr:GNAT family N-acetyltransferase [Alicyclobacillus sp. ALC3]